MYRHVVMFRWAEDVGTAHVAAAQAAFDDLPSKVPAIRSYVHGPNIGTAEDNFDYGIVADFDDEAGFVAYRDHPDHVGLVTAHIAGRVAGRAAFQYDVE